MTTYLESREDLEWLRDVHAINIDGIAAAILFGNEDSPERIETYSTPHVGSLYCVYIADDNGTLHAYTPEGEQWA